MLVRCVRTARKGARAARRKGEKEAHTGPRRDLRPVRHPPRATTGKLESWIDVARDQKKLDTGETPGDVMRYASLNTTVLTRLIEDIENKPFVEVFQKRLWSKLYARQS